MFKGLTKMNNYIHVWMACTLALWMFAFGSAWFWDKAPAPTYQEVATHSSAKTTDNLSKLSDWWVVKSLINECGSLENRFDFDGSWDFNEDDLNIIVDHVRWIDFEWCRPNWETSQESACNTNCDWRISLIDISVASRYLAGELSDDEVFSQYSCNCVEMLDWSNPIELEVGIEMECVPGVNC